MVKASSKVKAYVSVKNKDFHGTRENLQDASVLSMMNRSRFHYPFLP